MLKVGCPVILLKNMSERLVNGLRGEVVSLTRVSATVQFSSIGMKTTLKKTSFTRFVVLPL
jgi:hypothetical protein